MDDGPGTEAPAPGPPGGSVLDFCVIGAQKSGTTTLFEHLRSHPALRLPADKEAPWFHRPELVAQGPEAFARAYFPGLDRAATRAAGARIGTVTPHYMCEPGAAAALADALPRLRLVAILRDPLERAHSHYRMAVRRGHETRTFEEAVRHGLHPDDLARARLARDLGGTYVVWSEYGRVLATFLERFHRSQLLVLYTDDLAQDPGAVLDAIHRHIGVGPHRPPDLYRRDHQGGDRRRFPALPAGLARSPLGALYRRLPVGTRARLFMRIDHWNVRTSPAPPDGGLPEALAADLRRHFAADQAALEDRFGVRLRWAELHGG